jgi:signal transduction histidine kinase
MQNKRLAQWLQDHLEMLGATGREQDQTFHTALYESIIDMALHGDTRMVDSMLESTTAYAVATNRQLTDLLTVPELMRQRIWHRIGDEIDPEPAYAMFAAVDTIFIHIIKITIDEYMTATKLAQAARAAEIARLYTDSEQKVLKLVTEMARANRELSRLEQAKTDFISIAAHELKTPLTLVQGYVNILRESEAGPQVTPIVEGIERGAQRMNSIIEDMLDLSAMDLKRLGLVLEPVRLSKAVDLVISQLQAALTERRQTITCHGLPALPPVEADRRRLHQIVHQLISNAIKYTPDGGHIAVSGQLLPAAANTAERVQIIVQDNGVGIAPEDRTKIFEKFYRVGSSSLHSTHQTKFMGAGPGLGLAITKGLVQAHGGQITCDSPGFDMQNCPGSTFTLTLPVIAAPPPEVQVKRIEAQLATVRVE